METLKVGIREFRENLANYVLEGGAPVAVTRHGDTVGYFIPTRRRPSADELSAFDAKAAKWQEALDGAGIDEEEILKEFRAWRKAKRR